MSEFAIFLCMLGAMLISAIAIFLVIGRAHKNAPSSGLSTVHEREPLYVPTSEPGLYMVVEQEPESREYRA